jgi:hypothetical protein
VIIPFPCDLYFLLSISILRHASVSRLRITVEEKVIGICSLFPLFSSAAHLPLYLYPFWLTSLGVICALVKELHYIVAESSV